jgi:hypothetical protein
MVYIILLVIDDDVLNIAATRSYWNNPTSNQFKAPIITTTNATLSKGVLLIVTTPFHIFFKYIFPASFYYNSSGNI